MMRKCCLLILIIIGGVFLLRHYGVQMPWRAWSGRLLSTVEQRPLTDDLWIVPTAQDSQPLWGIRNGMVVGTTAADFDHRPNGPVAPGLLQVGFADDRGQTYFVNYLSLELLSQDGTLDQSEPERIEFVPMGSEWHTQMKAAVDAGDSVAVKQLLAQPAISPADATTLEQKTLSVIVRTSAFTRNQTQIYLVLTIDQQRPRELGITVYHPNQSTVPLRVAMIGATYGNLARLRMVQLADRTIRAPELFANATANSSCFFPVQQFPLAQLPRTADGAVQVTAWNDEAGEWQGDRGNGVPYYGYSKFAQYWRSRPTAELKLLVNGRSRYFGGFINACGGGDITGGTSFENFQLVQPFSNGQTVWFGYQPLP